MLRKSLLFILLFTLVVTLFLQYRQWRLDHPVQEEATLPLKSVFRSFPFNREGNLKGWEDKVFLGKATYKIDIQDGNGFVHAKSKKSSSAIFHRIKFDPDQYPILAWKWRVGKFPDKKSAKAPKQKDDFPARVYVVFISRFFTSYRCIEYVWDESIKEGTVVDSPYSEQIKHLVVQSGDSKEWISEKQNIVDDYKKLFGEKPNMNVAAIALMTDSDGSQSEAEGFFDDIQIGRDQ